MAAAANSATATANVSLHPLVLINISDQWTRVRVQSGDPSTQVIGALLGVQTGRSIEVFNSFELVVKVVDGHAVLDRTYLTTKLGQFKEVFKNYDILGWYTTGPAPTDEHIRLHQQMLPFNENPLFLLLNAGAGPASNDLPITVFESYIDVSQNPPLTTFTEGSYKIETGDAERISVNHIASITDSGSSSDSRSVVYLMGQRNAIAMLQSRLSILRDYVCDVRDGKMPADHALLRDVASLCHRLPTMESDAFKDETIKEQADVLLMTYLATLTRGVHLINEVADKYSIVHDRSRRMRGSVF